MSKKKLGIIIAIVLLVLIIGFIGYQIYENSTLKKEGQKLLTANLASPKEFDSIKCLGKNRVVEETMKNYFYNNATKLNSLLAIKESKEFTSILSYENYEKDGPAFTNSLAYLEKNKSEFNQAIDEIINAYTEEAIEANGDSLNDKDKELYNEMMLTSAMKTKYESMRQSLATEKVQMNSLFDTSYATLKLLVDNQNKWYLEGNEIKITSKELFAKYQEYMNVINKNKE